MIQFRKHLPYLFSTIANISFVMFGMLVVQDAKAQCTNLVTHQAGTLQIGCTTVTVTPAGETDEINSCGIGPYVIGDNPSGSFTFTFSPPVSGVTIDLSEINNFPNLAVEEVEFEVNGAFYPITVPGTTHSCATSTCIILPNGRVGAPPSVNGPFTAGWENQPITETINSLKITNVVTMGFPAGSRFTLRFCESCCDTDAGVLSGSPLHLCVPQSASFPIATQTNLEPDDLLQYILFTDLNDTLGSIVATSSTPNFAFGPPLQLNTTYYGAAIAGNEVNGNVDLDDPCLDISNAVEILWNPQPTVSFAVANPEVCAEYCLTFDVTFTGTPPFSLTYTAGGGPLTQSFSANAGTLDVCPPAGTPPGAVTLAAVSLTDANCVCE